MQYAKDKSQIHRQIFSEELNGGYFSEDQRIDNIKMFLCEVVEQANLPQIVDRIKNEEFLEYMRYYKLLKKYFSPWS